jgi:hypothetical protein
MEFDDGGEQAGWRQRAQGRGQETNPTEDNPRRSDRLDQAEQNVRRVHGGEKAGREEEGGKEIQRRSAGEDVKGSDFLDVIITAAAMAA